MKRNDNAVTEPRARKEKPLSNQKKSKGAASRRSFLAGVGGVAAAGWAASAVSLTTLLSPQAEAVEVGPPSQNPSQRAAQVRQIRIQAAQEEAAAVQAAFPHPTNGDEERYASQAFAGNFSKTLPHDANGLVIPSAYQALVSALSAGTKAALDAVPAGGPGRMTGPLSPLAFQMEGADSTVASSPFVPPSVASAGGAAEMVELYWLAYLRDVPFINYGSNGLVGQAVTDMNRLSGYAGPRPVTAQNLFRYPFFGATDGPQVSQLLYQTHSLDGATFVPKITTRAQVADPDTGQVLTGPGTGVDFMTNLTEYVTVENGNGGISPSTFDPTQRFVRNVRDLGQLAASDSIYSLYFRAAVILANLGVPLDPNNPYATDTRMTGFNTFSTAWLFGLMGRVHDTEAQAFYQKWYVHRKVRPEAHANLVDGIVGRRFSLNPSMHPDLLNSSVLPLIFERNRQLNVKRGLGSNGSFLCPQEAPGGSPSHPSSPAGHAYTAGACVTALKAVFDVGTPANPRPWPVQPVEASSDGLTLLNSPANLTVLGELNKLAANISAGRDMSGIHWRVSDNMHGMFMAEDVTIRLLNEIGLTYPESFPGFTLTKFDGTTILVGGKRSATGGGNISCPV